MSTAGAQPTSRTDRRAYDLIGENFGPGANGPLTVVVQLDSALVADRARREGLAASLRQELAALPGVAAVSPPTAGPDDVLLIATVTPGPARRTNAPPSCSTPCGTPACRTRSPGRAPSATSPAAPPPG